MMGYWLIVNVLLVLLAWRAVRWSYQPTDDFGRGVVALVAAVAAAVSTMAYGAAVFWLHRFF